ncbi:MAG: exodeoxyribonuclease VII small subunit [Acidobacteria bacterium RIFCSPLOWO2_12_FULL_54_10]|nr:MAG: exodeoxyribonuclease VII small subunit [Acidobacteria bacterium RIFCSPLOWO2_12_FULL_54_10]
MKEKPEDEIKFEHGLDRLEKIVQELEKGDLPLDRALQLFEEGMQVSTRCRRQLEEAENKIEMLMKKNDGKIAAEPFSLDDDK